MEVIWTEHWETWVRFFSSSSSILMTWKVMNSSGSRDSSIITEIIPWHTDTMISQTVSSKTENGNFRNSHKTYYRSVIATSSWSLLCVPIVIDPVSDHHKCVFCLWMSIRCWFGESARARFGAVWRPSIFCDQNEDFEKNLWLHDVSKAFGSAADIENTLGVAQTS